MKKLLTVLSIALILLLGYVVSIYSFKLDANDIGKITVMNEQIQVEISPEETISLINNINALAFNLFHDDIETITDPSGYSGPPITYHIFIYDKKGNEMGYIAVHDEKNISYANNFEKNFPKGLQLHYHATNGTFNLENLYELAK